MNTRQTLATLRVAACAVLGIAYLAAGHATTPLADQPVFTNTGVPGNLSLVISAEFPTAVGVAHQGQFVAGTKYLGYFDAAKCYRYRVGTELLNDLSHFYPVSASDANYKCVASGFTDTWSGSFLNWLTMQAIDPFRWALTGGNRVVDTTDTTILERAWASADPQNGSDANFPVIPTIDSDPLKTRPSPSSSDIADHTALPGSMSSIAVSVRTRGNKVRFTKTGDLNVALPTTYNQAVAVNAATTYEFYARVKVCDSGVGFSPESNCKAYPSGYYKPEGLIQQYAEKMRYNAWGYLNDPTDDNRDGGVMRARQKFVGPNVIRPGSLPSSNPAKEWDPSTGVLNLNPDTTDALATTAAYGVPVVNSGVINYLNKFGRQQQTYKRRDPVSELYYGALRYLKNQGPVTAWTNIAGDANKIRLIDGFPVITNWDDPIQYSCQRNFILGIGDTNTNWDRNLPGATGTNEPSKPAEVTADTTINTVTATDKVGQLQGMGSSLGTTAVSNGSYLIAGLAYDANTKDIRPDDPAKSNTSGKQTVQTYWLDVLEFGSYLANNQYYLAAKYGGFKVPNGYDPYANTTPLASELWDTNSDTIGGQPRPDNYYTASRPDQMVDGLTKIFAQAGNELSAFTTSFSTALPQVTLLGVGSYSAKYDASNWTGEITASQSTFDPSTGEPGLVERWSFSTKLAAQLTGTGWDTNRRVVTRNNSTGLGVPFRSANISASQLLALDTVYGTGVDSVTYLNYLRGDATFEEGQPAATAAITYRKRFKRLGDIVGSKTKAVGPPSAPFSTASNPGYATFKTDWAARLPVVYVGSNDGLLHAIDASLDTTAGGNPGKELFAYVPGALFQGPSATPAVNGLQSIGDPDFSHHFFVDGSPAVFDIDFGRTTGGTGTTDWRTVLVGPLGKGGKSYFALDVTNPAAITTETIAASKVLWEFSHADLGFTYGEPASVKTKKYGWVLIFGSGYNNADGQGYFFIVNPRTGALLEKIGTGVGASNAQAGLAHVQAFVLDRTDGTADTVYGGDLLGNLWRLDVSSATAAYPAPTKLAVLTDDVGNVLPVTSRPLVVIQPGTNKRYVTVGTGRLLDKSDTSNTQAQAYFAFMDGTGVVPYKSTDLPAGITFPYTNNKLKKLTDLTQKVTLNLATQIGWWVDLGTTAGSGPGWRVISDSTSFLGVVAFASMVPSAAVCSPSGTSRIYAIDLGTGQSRLQAGEDFIPYNDSIAGVVTDLRFYSVSGVPRLIAGSDTGATKAIKGLWGTNLGMRRLNWRELPLAD